LLPKESPNFFSILSLFSILLFINSWGLDCFFRFLFEIRWLWRSSSMSAHNWQHRLLTTYTTHLTPSGVLLTDNTIENGFSPKLILLGFTLKGSLQENFLEAVLATFNGEGFSQ
jgi:hypothetical protein